MLPGRRAFTLVELLVVIGIVGILMGLLLPAVQQARESARSAECRNNLKQIGVALHLYHGAHHTFPSGCAGLPNDPVNNQGWGWAALLLPFVEEQPLYDTLEPGRNSLAMVLSSAELQPYLRTRLAVFRCASDSGEDLQTDDRTLSGFNLGLAGNSSLLNHLLPGSSSGGLLLACINPPSTPSTSAPLSADSSGGVRVATSNYVASFGDFWQSDSTAWKAADYAGNGVFGSNTAVRMRDITDGTSQTFAIGERSWQSFASVWPGTDGWNRCEREGVPMVMATAFYHLNDTPDPYYLSCDPQGAAGFGSMHPAGANFLMADGAVRFVGNDIQFSNSSDPAQLGVFQLLARRNDGQPLEAD